MLVQDACCLKKKKIISDTERDRHGFFFKTKKRMWEWEHDESNHVNLDHGSVAKPLSHDEKIPIGET